MIFKLLVVACALVGMFIALYIHRKKKEQEKPKLICPRKFKCDEVITSKYSTLFGVGIERIGIVYYSLIGLLYSLAFVVPFHPLVLFALLVASACAVLFSLYLILVQAFALRKWCIWCLASASMSFALFVFALFGFDMTNLVPSLASLRDVFLVLHALGFIFGLGGATITDVVFFRFLKDRVISEHEAHTMDILSEIIWVGLGLLILSGVALYIPEATRLSESSKFLAKAVIVGVVLINGILLNLIVAPKLMTISFKGPDVDQNNNPRNLRKLAHVFGAISIVSWYSAFALGSFRSLPFSFSVIVGVYLATVLIAVIGSLIAEHRLQKL